MIFNWCLWLDWDVPLLPFHLVHLGSGTTQFCHSCPRARVPRVKHELSNAQDEQDAKSNENTCAKMNFLKTNQEMKLQRNKLAIYQLNYLLYHLPARIACPVSLE